MDNKKEINQIRNYFDNTLKKHGATPLGVDWNSMVSQGIRFEQLAKLINTQEEFSILDYGCGYGAFLQYLNENKYPYSKFFGYDISDLMVRQAQELFSNYENVIFSKDLKTIPVVDYLVASGVFNMKFETPDEGWTTYVLECLDVMHKQSGKGFASTFLTKYSDKDKMRNNLYYADPCMLFDYCKRHYSRNVAILHDYGVYDFTLIVRKDI